MAKPLPILERFLSKWKPLRDPAMRRSLWPVAAWSLALLAALACFPFLHLDTEPGGEYWYPSYVGETFCIYDNDSGRHVARFSQFDLRSGDRWIATQDISFSFPEWSAVLPTLVGLRPLSSFTRVNKNPLMRGLHTRDLNPEEFAGLTKDVDLYLLDFARHDRYVDPRVTAFLATGASKTWEVHWKILLGNALAALALVLAWFMVKSLRAVPARARELRRLAAGLCPRCSYTLGVPGITTCPECGTEIPPQTGARAG